MDTIADVDREDEVPAADARVRPRLSGAHAPAASLAPLLRDARAGLSGGRVSPLRTSPDLPPAGTRVFVHDRVPTRLRLTRTGPSGPLFKT